MENIQKILAKIDSAFTSTERTNAENEWRLISEVVIPNQSTNFGERTTPGQRKGVRNYDCVPAQACYDLAAHMGSTLVNPTSIWSRFKFANEELNNNDETIQWLEASLKKIHKVYSESNFYSSMGKAFHQLCALGSMVILQEEKSYDPKEEWEGIRYKSVHLSEVAFEEDYDGVVNALFLKTRMSINAAVSRWGLEVFSDSIKKRYEKNPGEEIEFAYAIMPRDKSEVYLNDMGLAPKHKRPYYSCYICLETKQIVEEEGYYEFPFHVARWSTMPGERYGRGPGHMAYGEIKTLYKTKEASLKALELAVNPPLKAVQRGVLNHPVVRPGSMVYMRNEINDIQPLLTGSRFDVSQIQTMDSREAIKACFFLDKLMLPPRTQTGEMTAYEVAERLAQMQRVLGPTMNRFNSEFLAPLVLRTFKILLRAGQLPPIPEVLKQYGIDIDLVFINQLARSQQMEEATNITGWVQEVGMLAQLKPEVLDLVDADAIAKYIGNIRGIPEIAIANNDTVQQIRQQRAQQQQAQQALEAGVGVADIASKTGAK